MIYLPVTIFGVVSTDWKYVLIAGLAGYAIPYILSLQIGRIPLEIITTVVAVAVSIVVLNLIRVGRKPFWLQHHLRAMIRDSHNRRGQPADTRHRPWTNV
jgi:hypothetical protein